MRILGIDPGSQLTGFGCIDWSREGGERIRVVACGTLRLKAGADNERSLPERLLVLHRELSQQIELLKPQVMVIEKVFFAKNAVSALKLGQARGAALLTGAMHGLEIVEYNPTEVKAAVVGYGRADKAQVAKMVHLLTGHSAFETADASDAVALALCHSRRLGLPEAQRMRMQKGTTGRKSSSGGLAEQLGIRLGAQGEVLRK